METKDILKALRKSKGFANAKEFCDMVDISYNTYQNYETGKRLPTAEMLMKISDFYGVTTDYLLGREPQLNPLAEISVNVDDDKFIEIYSQLPEYAKQVFIDTMIKLSEAAAQKKQKIINLPKSVLKASAGTGNWLDEQQLESVSVLDTPQTKKANLIIEVDGDSMEPLYSNGDNVLVNTKAEVSVGDIGIFIVDGNGYIKKLGENRLISVNPEYDDIFPTEYSDFRCVGKVLGKADIVE